MVVSLYAKVESSGGKYSPYSPVFFMCSMIRARRRSYSAGLYCLLKMQCVLFRSPAHPNRFFELMQSSQYVQSDVFDMQFAQNRRL